MRYLIYIILIVLLVWLDLSSGSTGWIDLSLSDLWTASDDLKSSILRGVRIPAVLAALSAGAGLAAAGLIMQVVFSNPLAGPGVMGVSSGASLLVALAVLGGIGLGVGQAIMAIAGALAVLVLILAASVRLQSDTGLLILGLMIGYMAGAVVSVLQYSAAADRLQRFVHWSLGSFQMISWQGLGVMIPGVGLGILATFLLRRRLDLLLLGETHITSLGYDPRWLRMPLLLVAGLLVGVITAYCGPLVFIGLAAPHVARMLTRSDLNGSLLIHTTSIGMILGLASLYVVTAHWITWQIPLNAVLSLFGAPVVIWLLARKKYLA